ncbi:hypothetical protein BJ322DRAFT_1013264 [Thelephora terrestris]|uniref:Integrase core domain-containing protein n=1 Tax=Thelephora terrestris TaxID=56493 RepID=A0A9P6H5P5_9AGAM|nr:hypothetical protein BJ322DRAFT_1013264 [Thelephora terrestris]
MEEKMGPDRGSYIWGRSVHNSRIERLWYDMTEGFGRKWKEFFYTLEDCHGLEPSDPSHVWLLHLLFLPTINEDALAWAETWNSHKIQLEGERRSSPQQLFTRSSLLDGVHGLPPQGEEPEDFSLYGVDWEAMEGLGLTDHPEDTAELGDRQDRPEWMNEVVCEPPDCPLTDEQVKGLGDELAAVVDTWSRDMDVQRAVWIKAFGIFSQMIQEAED